MMAFVDPFSITVETELTALRATWVALAGACGNPFTTWEWASTWWKHFGEDREQRILVLSESGEAPAAIFPLYVESRGPLRILRQIGHFPADELGAVCAPDRALEVSYALRRHLDERRDWDLMMVERVSEMAGLGGPLDGHRLRLEPMPELKIETDDWDEFLASKSSNFRGQVRNYERRLKRDHELVYRLCDDPDRLGEDIGTLVDLHRRGWAARGKEGALPDHLVAFHRDFAPLALERGWLRFWIAELDGEPAAAWYGFRLGGADYFYQGGRAPEHERASVGFVLQAHTLRDAVESGIGTYKLLLGAEEYKKRFSSREATVETFAVRRGVRGAAGLAAARAEGSLRRRFQGD